MVNIMGHSVELVSTLKTLWDNIWVDTVYHSTIFNIGGPYCRLHYSFWDEENAHFENFQVRGNRWVYHRGITSVTRVASIFFA